MTDPEDIVEKSMELGEGNDHPINSARQSADREQPVETEEPTPPWTDLLTMITEVSNRLTNLEGSVAPLPKRTDDLARALSRVSQSQGTAAAQVLALADRIDEAGRGVAEGKFLSLARELFSHRDLIHDLAASHDSNDGERWAIVLRQVDQMIAAQGIERFDGAGKVDFNLHQPVDRVAAETAAGDETVVRSVRPGYRLGQRVLRHAEVVVAVWSETPDSAEDPQPAELTDNREEEMQSDSHTGDA